MAVCSMLSEIGFIVTGTASGTIPLEQLSAWLMAAWLNGLTIEETRALAVAMRDSGEKVRSVATREASCGQALDWRRRRQDQFSRRSPRGSLRRGGTHDQRTSSRLIPGGTLDKLDSIPGFRSALTLAEFEAVLRTVRRSHRQPDTDAGSRRSCSVCPARSHRNR